METKVINYINRKITCNSLKKFLINLISSVEINEKLLCLCILIELKNSLLDEVVYCKIIDYVKSLGLTVSYETFTDNITIVFNEKYLKRIKFSRVVTYPVYEKYIGSFRNNRFEINEQKIKDYGWSTGNGVVWVTPQSEIATIISNAKPKRFPADDVCDHVGFARTKSFANTRSPRKPYLEFVVVNYSDKFDEDVYQSNSLNANWKADDILFVSYPKLDGFGRTYNENGVVFAKEQVHEK